FSGFSTGACIGHVGPEALAGGPVGKLRAGDVVEIIIDLKNLEGSVHLIGEEGDGASDLSIRRGDQLLAERSPRDDLSPHPDLPEDTRLWAMLQAASGGTWGGCVFDVDAIADYVGDQRVRNDER
ncbi:MAG: dihydroxy-acid dehydratase, partial [Rhodothermales bacterium]